MTLTFTLQTLMKASDSLLHCETLPYDLNGTLHFVDHVSKIWTYGIPLWDTASNSNIEILQRYQNEVLQAIVNAPWYIYLTKSYI